MNLLLNKSNQRKRSYNHSRTFFSFMALGLLLIAWAQLSLLPLNAKAVHLKPIKDARTENHVIELFKQARQLYKSGKKVDARLVLLKAAKFDQTAMSPYIHALLATVYRDLGNPNQAVSESLLSLKFNPDQDDLLYNLGIYCEEANRYDEAITFLKQYIGKVSGEKKKRAQSLITLLEEEQIKSKMYPSDSADYLDKLTAEDNVNRWPKAKFPLKVHIQSSSKAKGFQPGFPEIAREAFVTWYRASNKKTAFKFVSSLSDADINLEWTDKRLRTNNDKRERMKAGLTTSTATVSGEIKKARIQVRTLNPFSKKGTPEDQVVETCLHEIGHALGLNGHSTNQSDIMYLGVTKRQLPALTRRDKTTISKLYKAYQTVAMTGIKDKKQSVANIHTPPPISTNQPSFTKTSDATATATAAATMAAMQSSAIQPGYQTPRSAYYPQAPAVTPYATPTPYPYPPPGYPNQAAAYQQPYGHPYGQPVQGGYYPPAYYPPGTAYQQPAPQVNYAPPMIQQQVASPYPVQPYYQQYAAPPQPTPGPYGAQQPYMTQTMSQPQTPLQTGQNNAVPQSLQMIDNIFQNLKPKIQQFLNNPQGQPGQQIPYNGQ